jgi:hypothetical protein
MQQMRNAPNVQLCTQGYKDSTGKKDDQRCIETVGKNCAKATRAMNKLHINGNHTMLPGPRRLNFCDSMVSSWYKSRNNN